MWNDTEICEHDTPAPPQKKNILPPPTHPRNATACLRSFKKEEEDMHCMYNVTLRRVRAIFVVVEKQSGCVSVALGIQHAERMRHIVICSLSGSTVFFHITSQTARFGRGEVIEHKMCVLIFSTAFV